MKRSAVYLALTTIAIAQPLLQLYGNNVAVFAAADYEGAVVVLFALIVLFVPPLVLVGLDVVFSWLTRSRAHLVHLVLVQVALWAAVSVALRSVSFGPWVADASFTFAVAAAITWAYSRLPALRSWVATMSPLSIAVVVLFAIAANAVINPPDAKVVAVTTSSTVATAAPGTPKDQVSVLWIVMDEGPLFSLMNNAGGINANRFPGFAKLAASSTWYRNALSTASKTVDAVPAMLASRWPGKRVGPVLGNYPNNLFTLMNGHIAMDAHEVVTKLCPKDVCSRMSVSGNDALATANAGAVDAADTAEQQASMTHRTPLSSFIHDALVVMGHKILPEGLRERLPAIDEAWGGFGQTATVETSTTSSTITVAGADSAATTLPVQDTVVDAGRNSLKNWEDMGPLTQIPFFDGAVKRAARSSKATLHFTHVLVPHRPWVLTPDMRVGVEHRDYRANTDVDGRRDRYEIHLAQYAAVDSMIGEMVDSLKRSANWNRTMIVVTADHGLTFKPGSMHRETIDPNNPDTLEDIFRVPLFIKYPDQQAPVVDDCTASAVDIFPTVIAATGIDAGWKLAGADLKSACPARTSRRVMWPEDATEMSTGVDALMARVHFYDTWVKADGTVDDIYRVGLSGGLIEQMVPATAPTDTGLTWKGEGMDEYRNIGTGRLAPGVNRTLGEITTKRNFSSTEEGLWVVDGRIVGVLPELAGQKKGAKFTFAVIPMARLLQPGTHTVEMWTVDMADPSKPVYKRVVQ